MTSNCRAYRRWKQNAIILFGFVMVSGWLGFGSHGKSEHRLMKAKDAIKVTLRAEQVSYSIGDSIELEVTLRNEDEAPVYIYRELLWGYGGGLILHIHNEQGDEVEPNLREDTLLPPPSDSDPGLFVRLDQHNLFGTRRIVPVKNLTQRAGKYTLQVEYRSPVPRGFMDPKLQKLRALWHEDPSLFSNAVPLNVQQ
jgi:hypothetical protein